MRDYQRKKSAYYLPKYAYRQALIIARSYPEVLEVLQNGKRKRIVMMTLQHQAEAVEAALAEVPDKYHREVCASLTHDIGVIARTISMVEKQPCEEGK